jgi:CubicO group peptidase (beta-lactamase class C family)
MTTLCVCDARNCRSHHVHRGVRGTRLGFNQGDAIFFIASMTKAVTTAAPMQLVERGRLWMSPPPSSGTGKASSVKRIRPSEQDHFEACHQRRHVTKSRDARVGLLRRGLRQANVRMAVQGGSDSANVRAGYPLAVRHGTPLDRAVGGGCSVIIQAEVRSHVGELRPPDRQTERLRKKPRTSLRLPKRTTKAAASNSMTADYARFMQMILHKGAVATGRASWKRRRRS